MPFDIGDLFCAVPFAVQRRFLESYGAKYKGQKPNRFALFGHPAEPDNDEVVIRLPLRVGAPDYKVLAVFALENLMGLNVWNEDGSQVALEHDPSEMYNRLLEMVDGGLARLYRRYRKRFNDLLAEDSMRIQSRLGLVGQSQWNIQADRNAAAAELVHGCEKAVLNGDWLRVHVYEDAGSGVVQAAAFDFNTLLGQAVWEAVPKDKRFRMVSPFEMTEVPDDEKTEQ